MTSLSKMATVLSVYVCWRLAIHVGSAYLLRTVMYIYSAIFTRATLC